MMSWGIYGGSLSLESGARPPAQSRSPPSAEGRFLSQLDPAGSARTAKRCQAVPIRMLPPGVSGLWSVPWSIDSLRWPYDLTGLRICLLDETPRRNDITGR